MSVKILGTGICIPEKIIDNDDLSKIVETNDEWIVERTGISKRHVVNGETTWSMGVESATNALKNAKLKSEDIDAVIGVTISPDFFYPSLSCIIAKKLGIKNPLTVDISAACSGLVYAMDLANRYLMDDDYKHVLIVCSETLSKQTDYTDRGTCILFGDASGSLVLTKGKGLFKSVLSSEQNGMEALASRALPGDHPFVDDDKRQVDDLGGLLPPLNRSYCHMAGQDVYRFAVRSVPDAVRRVLKKADYAVEDVDLFLFHQANLRIIEKVSAMLKIDMDKVYSNIENYGNTSSASMAICIHECLEKGIMKDGQKLIMTGFGGGLTYGALVMEVNL